jgi:hypothetical protein
VPQDQSQFGNLFPLLAQLEQGTFTRLGVHHLGNPLEYAAVLVTDSAVARLELELVFMRRLHAGGRSNIVHSDAIVVLLLRSSCGLSGGSSLCLGLSLRLCLSLCLCLRLGLSVLLLLQTVV